MNDCALAGLSVTWADNRTLTTSTAKFGAQQVGSEHQDAEVVLADPVDGSAKLTNTNAVGKIVLAVHGGHHKVKLAEQRASFTAMSSSHNTMNSCALCLALCFGRACRLTPKDHGQEMVLTEMMITIFFISSLMKIIRSKYMMQYTRSVALV